MPFSPQKEGDKADNEATSAAGAGKPSPLAPDIILPEEYNPSDLETFAAPWTYVADHVEAAQTKSAAVSLSILWAR